MTRYQDSKCRPRTALTLLEMIIAMAILSIVFAAVLPQFRAIQSSWDSQQAASETLQNGRVLMEHLYGKLSESVRITAVSDAGETDGYMEFEDNEGNKLRYDIAANNYVEFGVVGSLGELAGPVSQLQFTCYDACDLDTPITDVNNIRSVQFQATLSDPFGLGQGETFTALAYLRTNGNPGALLVTPSIAVSDRIEVKDDGRIEAMTGTIVVATNSAGHDKITVENNGVIDGGVYVGPDGSVGNGVKIKDNGEITGSTGVLDSEVAICEPTEPNIDERFDKLKFDAGITVISGDFSCEELTIEGDGIVQIGGDVTIIVEKDFVVKGNGQLLLLDGASLTVYSKDDVKIEGNSQVNVNTNDPTRLRIYHLANKKIELWNNVRAYATVVAALAEFNLKDYAEFYGTFTGEKVKIENSAVFYAFLGAVSVSSRRILP